MDRAIMAGATLGATRLADASFWQLFCYCISGLTMVWLPLTALQPIDALLVFRTWRELGNDLTLLVVLLAGVALVGATTARAVAALLGRFNVATGTVRCVAWALVGLPITLLCTVQFAVGVKFWLEVANGGLPFILSPIFRILLALTVLMFALVFWRRLGTVRLTAAAVGPIMDLRLPSLALTIVAIINVLWQAPVIWGQSGNTQTTRPIATPSSPDIFVISLDTLAAEDAGLCGTGSTAMPRLRALAATSTCFTRFYASSNFTNPATSTMDTGALPWSHWAVNLGGGIARQLRETSVGYGLQKAGYTTHFVGAALQSSPRYHGTYRGYDSVELVASNSLQATVSDALTIFPDSSLPILIYLSSALLGWVDVHLNGSSYPYPPEWVYTAAQRELDQSDRARPAFIWLHTLQPHSPYLPSNSTKYKLLPAGELEHWRDFLPDNQTYDSSRQALVDKHRLRYRESIMGSDELLGHFLESLANQKRLDGALVIVTSDHGESFERGWLGHGGQTMHEAVIRIPLLIKLPGQRLGRVVEMPASQADLAPTLLSLAGGKPLPLSEGRSLRPLLTGEAMAPTPVFAMAMQRESRFRPIRGGQYAVMDDHFKLVYDLAKDRTELYDLASDPHERVDLAVQQPEVTLRLRTLLRTRIAQAETQRQRWFGP